MIRSPLNVTAATSSNFRSVDPLSLCLTLDDARAVLEHWQDCSQLLGFSFFRAAESVAQEGYAKVVRIDPHSLTLGARDRRLVVAIENASIEFTQVAFRRHGFRTIDVEGLFMSLANDDWLFLFQETKDHARRSRSPAEETH